MIKVTYKETIFFFLKFFYLFQETGGTVFCHVYTQSHNTK